ncbi:major facilitator superfamily domain-containing protein [Powellomyces hirtus]|nr:major facilitator superfamily domain-containing protein [Powellomyces hirtus]
MAPLPSIVLRQATTESHGANPTHQQQGSRPPRSVIPAQRRNSDTHDNTDYEDDEDDEFFAIGSREDQPLLSTSRKDSKRHDSDEEDGQASPASRPPSYATLVAPAEPGSVYDSSSEYGEDGSPPKRTWRARVWRKIKRTRLPPRDTMVVLFAQLVTEASRGIVLPIMWPYVKLAGGNSSTYGTMISLFSVGRLVLSVPFGEWADRRGSSREVLIAAAILGAISNMVYSFAWALPHPIWWLYGSRLACGFSTGTIAVFRAYLASSVPPSERTKAIAWSGMAQYAGFSLTPIISTLIIMARDALASSPPDNGSPAPNSPLMIFSRSPSSEDPPANTVSIAACILPTIFLALVNLMVVPLLMWCMPKKDPIAHAAPPSPLPLPAGAHGTSSSETKLIRFGFVLFFILNLVLRGVLGVTETIAPEMYEHHNQDDDSALESSGQFFFFLGLAGLFVFLLVDPIQRRVMAGDKLLIVGILMVVGGTVLNIDPEPERTLWNWFSFVAGMILIWSIGSPVCQTLTVSMFSKMLGSRPQGSLIGWITTAGSIGRIVFPALVSISASAAVWVNWMDVVLCLGCVVGIIVFERYVRLVRKREHMLLPPPCDPMHPQHEVEDDSILDGDTDNEEEVLINQGK